MAIVARFSFDVPFGRKAETFALLEEFKQMADEIGFPRPEVLVGSIGAPESRIESNYRYESLAALEATWEKLDHPKMAEFHEKVAKVIVPGSHRWEILRVRE